MFFETLRNLYDNYITGFPKTNLSEPQWKDGSFSSKIVTYYDIDGAKIRLEITYDSLANRFEIKKFDGEFNSVSIFVIRQKGSTSAEEMVKKLYGELALTKAAVKEIAEELEEKKEEEKEEAEKEEKEKAKEEAEKKEEEKSDEEEFLSGQKEAMGKGGKIKKK